MAKKGKRKGKVAKEISSLDKGINAMFQQYPQITKKEQKEILKELTKQEKKALKNWEKTGSGSEIFKLKNIEIKKSKVENQTDRIKIDYGILQFNPKRKYFQSIKKKEQWLDGLYSRSMKKILNETQAPKTVSEAKQLEGLIEQYSKKIKGSKFYNPHLVENSINKLTNFRDRVLSPYEYNDYISTKKDIIYDEIDDFDNGREIEDYFEIETGEPEGKYEAVEKPILVNGILVGIEFNFF